MEEGWIWARHPLGNYQPSVRTHPWTWGEILLAPRKPRLLPGRSMNALGAVSCGQASWPDVEGIHHDEGPERSRILRPRRFDRQRMVHGSQPRYRQEGRLGYLRRRIRIEGIRNDVSIQDYTGNPGLGSASADPAHRRPGKGERGLRAWHRRDRGGSLTVWSVSIALNPTEAVGDGRIGLLAAPPRRDHVERIHDDDGSHSGRVLPAGHLDRQGMARVGKAHCLEVFHLEYVLVGRVRGRGIGLNLLHEDPIQKYASDPAVIGTKLAEPAHPRTGEGERGVITRGQRARGGPAAPLIARNALDPAGAGEDDRRIRILQARDRHGRNVERVHEHKGKFAGHVLLAGYFDRQLMAGIGEVQCSEQRYLDFFRLPIHIALGN